MMEGYRAYVQMYGESYYVDTFTGEGYDKVLAKIDPLLGKLASTTYISNSRFEDLKSEFTIIAIEGIKAFDPHRGVKLSTFLQIHLRNKRTSMIHSQNKMSNNAVSCHDNREADSDKIKKVKDEIHFSALTPIKGQEGGDGVPFEYTIPDKGWLGVSGRNALESVEFKTSLMKASSKLDKKTRKIIELMYFEDYSIKDVAKKTNLTRWGVSLRLKNLARKGSFRSVFNQKRPTCNERQSTQHIDLEDNINGSKR